MYLNHRGNIPPESVVRKGERRTNPFKEMKKFNSTNYTDSAGLEPFPPPDPDEEGEGGKTDKKRPEEMES